MIYRKRKNKGRNEMGMPVITPGTGTEEEAVTDIITSVALQESALSHILNAEGEKMQKIIEMNHVTREELLCLNKSVELMVDAITRLEMILQAKLEVVLSPGLCVGQCIRNNNGEGE